MRSWTLRCGMIALVIALVAVPLRAEDDLGSPPAGSANPPESTSGGSPVTAPPSAAPSSAASPEPVAEVPLVGAEGTKTGGTLLPQGGKIRRLTLQEAVHLALRTNLSLQSASYNPRIAMETWRAASAIFDPLLTSALDYAYNEQPNTVQFFGDSVITNQAFHGDAGVSRLTRTGGRVAFLYQADRLDTTQDFVAINPNWTQNVVLEGSQPILRGAGDVVMVDIRRSRNGMRIAQEGQRTVVENVLLEVVATYWQLVLAQQEIEARRSSEQVAAKLLSDAQARYEAKVGTPLQVAEARAGLERRIGDRVQAEGDRGNVQDRLRTLIYPFTVDTMERGLFVIATSGEEAVRGMAPDPNRLEHYVQMAVANRPQIRATQWGIQNRSLDIYQAANAVKPQLDFVGRVGTTGLDKPYGGSLEEMLSGQALQAGAGVQFSMFVGQRSARANLRLAQWARRQAVVDQKELENQVILEVRTAIRDVVVAKARQAAAAEQLRSAEAQLRGEQALLENGKSTPFNVLLKEDDRTNARSRIFRAQADRRIAEARFWRSMGFLADTLGVAGTTPAQAD